MTAPDTWPLPALCPSSCITRPTLQPREHCVTWEIAYSYLPPYLSAGVVPELVHHEAHVAPEGGLRGLGDRVLILAAILVRRGRLAHDVLVGDPDDAAVDVLAREEVNGPAGLRGERAALPAGVELEQERVGARVRILVTDICHGTLGDVVLELELDADLGLVVGRRQVHDVRRGHAR